jgi:hypothetical protein
MLKQVQTNNGMTPEQPKRVMGRDFILLAGILYQMFKMYVAWYEREIKM